MIYLRILTLLFIGILFSCGGTKEAVMVAPPEYFEEETLDTMVVTAPAVITDEEVAEIENDLPTYNESETRFVDITHIALDLSFDWSKQHVIGNAILTLSPVFYPQNHVLLDAKGFEIKSVMVDGNKMEYDYDGSKLFIPFNRDYDRTEKLNVEVNYIAKPEEGPVGGSAAITSDKGLFFIDPLDEDPEKPSQIWTQGETENNSRWFPTIDKPNERTTQEVKITIEEKYVTLSNGLMTTSVKNADGTRTDTWKMDKPHAPYLFMLAIGEFAVVKEKWRGKEIGYYVEPKYESAAKNIFNHTPEMLTFFSNLLDYPYPWDKYSQVICRDYVSGAMENTTAVIFGDFIQKTNRELIDDDNDYIVAHEMFHHWFGDLVTIESWANLTLQEGFANYSEYLWFEHKYGKDRAEAHRMSEMQGYFMSAAQQGTHPLIHYGYDNKEDMFDAHSYNKGGLVLHMLRDLLGDEAFFAGLNKYLRDNEYTSVEVDELRMAFEDITGRDLNWFFDQWYLSEGHPTLEVKYDYNATERKLYIDVDQVQDLDNHLPIYRLDVSTALYDKTGKATFYPLTLNQRSQGYMIEDIDEPAVVVFDGENTQLAEIVEDLTPDQSVALYKYSSNYMDKMNALGNMGSNNLTALSDRLLKEQYHTFRIKGLEKISLGKTPEKMGILEGLIKNDPHSSVRNAALKKIADYDYEIAKPYLETVLVGEDSYKLAATALKAMKYNDKESAIAMAEKYEDSNATEIVSVLADLYASSKDPKYLPYFEGKLNSVSLFTMFNFYNKYYDLLTAQSAEQKISSAENLAKISMGGSNMFRKFVATSTISKLKNSIPVEDDVSKIKLEKILKEIISQETDEGLLSRYKSF